jgi:hypothetical protein
VLALHYAAVSGHDTVIDYLVQRGVAIDATDNVRCACHCLNIRIVAEPDGELEIGTEWLDGIALCSANERRPHLGASSRARCGRAQSDHGRWTRETS